MQYISKKMVPTINNKRFGRECKDGLYQATGLDYVGRYVREIEDRYVIACSIDQNLQVACPYTSVYNSHMTIM